MIEVCSQQTRLPSPMELMSAKVFKGRSPRAVTVDGRPLPPRVDLCYSSPSGFGWGYGGHGPAQLALAILADIMDDQEAVRYHQEFKWACIARIPQDASWTLTEEDVTEWLDDLRLSPERLARELDIHIIAR